MTVDQIYINVSLDLSDDMKMAVSLLNKSLISIIFYSVSSKFTMKSTIYHH